MGTNAFLVAVEASGSIAVHVAEFEPHWVSLTGRQFLEVPFIQLLSLLLRQILCDSFYNYTPSLQRRCPSLHELSYRRLNFWHLSSGDL